MRKNFYVLYGTMYREDQIEPDRLHGMYDTFSISDDKNISIPYGVIKIGDSVFEGCDSLNEINIPDSVRIIGKEAFLDCGLNSVVIPESVEEIGERAFGYRTVFVERTVELKTARLYGPKKHRKPEKLEGFVIRGKRGGEAERYAEDNGFEFEEIK